MDKRINIISTQPQAAKAMYGLEHYLGSTAVSKQHKHLIKIRASQINKCAYCINMHTKEALESGETHQRIFLLDAWQETNLYSEQEKAILAMTEEITLISNHGLSEKTYGDAVALFGENYVAEVIMVIVTINAWNRIAISTALQPE